MARWPGVGRARRGRRARRSRPASTSSAGSATPARRRGSSRRPGSRSTSTSRPSSARRSRRSRPAIERLARARPLTRHLTAESLRPAGDGSTDLVVVSGASRGGRPVRAPAADPEAARLETRPARARAGRRPRLPRGGPARLADDAFVGKAPAPVVEGARRQEAELAEQVERLQDRLRALTGAAGSDGGLDGTEAPAPAGSAPATMTARPSHQPGGQHVPLEFLKRKGSTDAPAETVPTPASAPARRPGSRCPRRSSPRSTSSSCTTPARAARASG